VVVFTAADTALTTQIGVAQLNKRTASRVLEQSHGNQERNVKKSIKSILAVALLGLVGTAQASEPYPSKVITMLIPFAAGGPTDTVGRLIAQSMSKDLGQQVIVENLGGAGGTLAAAKAARANPDGYNIFLHHIGQSTAPSLYRKLSYNASADFETIGLVTDVPMTIVARANFPAANMQELLAYVRANKDKVTYANAGIGSASHLCGMLFQQAIGVDLTTVPYKGTGPAMNDLLGGQVDLMCDQTTNTTSQIKGGKIKAYAVTTKTPVKSLPDLPTLDKSGLPGFEVAVWHGLYAPKGTPAAIVDRLSKSLQLALKDPAVATRFAELGTEPSAPAQATPAAHRKHLDSEIARWKPIIEKAGQYAD
jgi:tripartite-type tricarboxylate transporter receptor subunit TctC